MMKGIFVLLAFVFLSSGVATAGPVEVSGGLDITGTPGTDGITFPDGTSQTSAVIGGQYQKRITATCSTGYAMRAIDSTGGVATCEPTGVSGILGTDNGGTGTSTAPSTSGQYLRSTGAGAWGVGGIQFTDLPSLSSGYVDLTTDQSIGGNKSFTGAISGPNVTSGTDPGHTHTASVPSGFMIVGETTTPPPGYTYTGKYTDVIDGMGLWAAKADMPTGRAGLTAATVNNKIYAIGGADIGYLTTNEEYDPVANTWATRADMPTARGYLAAATANNKIYAIGGSTDMTVSLTTNEEYDPIANTWATRADMPTARSYLAAAAVNDKVYVIGGYGTSSYLTTNEEYDPVANTWATRADMPTPRYALAAAAVNNKVYVIGGAGGSLLTTATNEEYDPVGNTWAAKASVPTIRFYFSAAAVDNKVYIMGGQIGGYWTTNEEYDPGANTWATKNSMPTGRYFHAAVAANNKIYAIGGNNGGTLTTNEEYDPVPHVYHYLHRKD